MCDKSRELGRRKRGWGDQGESEKKRGRDGEKMTLCALVAYREMEHFMLQ